MKDPHRKLCEQLALKIFKKVLTGVAYVWQPLGTHGINYIKMKAKVLLLIGLVAGGNALALERFPGLEGDGDLGTGGEEDDVRGGLAVLAAVGVVTITARF